MPSKNSFSTREATRSSLRTLLLCVALIAWPLTVCRWNSTVGVSLAVAMVGLICIAIGMRKRCRGATLVGVLLVVGSIGFVGRSAFTSLKWVGTQKLDVIVLVVNASTLTPVSGAKVQVLHGPYSLSEGPTPNVASDFEVVELENNEQDLITDQRGRTTFTYQFRAAGSDGMFSNPGYVDTQQVWLRVTAPGYVTTLLAMDRQSVGPRDIRDKTPLFVTVPVGKQ